MKCIERVEPPKEKLDIYKAMFPYLATKGNVVFFDNHRIVIPSDKVEEMIK